ncbi:MAG: response regulator transcription factor [Burkholderiaceae bacterium]|nr:response regulator transcription factor [Burkholderiaceae bacterium]
MIRVAICDDHQIVRAGFKQFFSETTDIEIVAEAANGKEALDIARSEVCDVMLLDINMPGQNGVDTLRTIKQGQPEFPIVILSMFPLQDYAVNLLKMGANGYLNKECDVEELAEAIRTVAAGHRYVGNAMGEILAQNVEQPAANAVHTTLSDREFQIFLHLAKGETVSDIAKFLSLSVKTVSTYRSRVMEKMGLRTNSDLTYYAIKSKLLD